MGGSLLRACGQDGSWNGTQPFCAGVCKICIVHYSIASRVQTMRQQHEIKGQMLLFDV